MRQERKRIIALLMAVLMVCSSVLPQVIMAAESIAEEPYESYEMPEPLGVEDEIPPVVVSSEPGPTMEMEAVTEGDNDNVVDVDIHTDVDENTDASDSTSIENNSFDDESFTPDIKEEEE